MFTTVFLFDYSNAYSYTRTLVHTCKYSSGTIKELNAMWPTIHMAGCVHITIQGKQLYIRLVVYIPMQGRQLNIWFVVNIEMQGRQL